MQAYFLELWSLIPRGVKIAGGILLAVGLALLLAYCSGQKSGKSKIEHQIDQANIKALETNSNAVSNAATDRSVSDQKILETKKELVDAVEATPDSLPNASRIALGCKRLRRQGTDTSVIPACAGR
jgi:hypothetical protein